MRQKKNQKGFSLTELAITLALIGIFALISVPKIVGTLNNLKLNLAAAKVATDIRYARDLAMSYKCIGSGCLTNKKCGVEFSTATNSYQVFCLDGTTKTLVPDPMTRSNMVIDFSARPEFSGVTLSSVSMCVGSCMTKELRFDSFGNPYDANNALLTAAATATLTCAGATRTVQVTQQTGYTEIV